MELKLYNTKDENNVINKKLELITTKEIHLKARDNILNPILLLSNNFDYTEVNYASMIDRFYFVDVENYQNDKMIVLSLQEDVLETYKDNILNSDFDIIEKSTLNNVGTVPTSNEIETHNFYSDVELKEVNSIILQTIGNQTFTEVE